MRTFGYSDAYRTMELMDRRTSVKLQGVGTQRFNARMADDVSNMKALNTPMPRTGKDLPPIKGCVRGGEKKKLPEKAKALKSIETLCEQLSKENKAMRRNLTLRQ